MSNQLLSRYVEERSAIAEHVSQILGRAESEERDLTEADTKALGEAETRMAEIDVQLKSLKSVLERQDSAADLHHLLAKSAARQATPQPSAHEPAPSFGSFVESEQYRGWNGNGKSGRFELDATVSELTRAALVTNANPGKALMPSVEKYMLPTAQAMRPLLDAVGRLPVSSNSLELVTYGNPKGATGAAVVAEGSPKPEGTIVTASETVTVPTIAFYLQASRQLLQDAPAARALIDDQLTRGLLTKIENNIGAAIEGGTYTEVVGETGQTALEVARVAMADLQSKGWTPNAILTDPVTAAGFDLFLLQQTVAGASLGMPVWGLQVIPVPGLPTTYVGDFKTGVTLLERTGVEIFISDSHGETFTSNIFTILAETRAAAVVTNATAIREITLTP